MCDGRPPGTRWLLRNRSPSSVSGAVLLRNTSAHPKGGRPLKKWVKQMEVTFNAWLRNCTKRTTPNAVEIPRKLKLLIWLQEHGTWERSSTLKIPTDPEGRTALVSRELARFNIDIAGLNETRLSEGKGRREKNPRSWFYCQDHHCSRPSTNTNCHQRTAYGSPRPTASRQI